MTMIMTAKARIKGKLILLGAVFVFVSIPAVGQVSTKGLSPAANTYKSYQDASIARDSGLNRPLDLLNDFYPSIEVRVENHDNIRRRSDIDEDDTSITISPALAYRSNIGRHQFYAAYTGSFVYHDEIEQEDSSSHNLSAKLGLDVSRSWDIDLFGAIGEGVEERGVSGTREFDVNLANQGADRVTSRSWGIDLAYGRKLDRLQAVLGYEYNESGFRPNNSSDEILAGNRDREQDVWHFDVDYRIASKTSVFGRIAYTETDYDRLTNSLDNEQVDYLLGLRWKATSKLSGVAGIGLTDRDFNDSNREGYEGNSYYVNLNYAINSFSNLQLSASRFVEEPSDLDSSFYESELVGIGWDHGLTEQLTFNAYAKLIDDDYDTNREDSFVDWGLGLDYAWKKWLTAGIYYGHVDRDSSIDNIDYDDSYFGIRLSSDLRPLLRKRNRKNIEPNSFGALQKSEFAQKRQ